MELCANKQFTDKHLHDYKHFHPRKKFKVLPKLLSGDANFDLNEKHVTTISKKL